MYCWGNSADGQAGAASSGSTVDAPKQITGTWSKLSAGGFHTCGISTTDQLSCWGRNTSNQLGGTQPIAVPAGNNGKWTSVKAGPTHTCAVAGAKTYCWGAGTEGSLGNGAFSNSATPVEVSAVGALGSLATGENFSCGAVNDADAASSFQIHCWGSNQYSLLLTNDAKVNVPQIVTKGGTPAWTAFAVGAHHMCAVEAGLLYCWGSNADGAVGSGVPDPTPVATATLVKTSAVLHSVIDNCSPNPCKNGGLCASSTSGYTCDCTGTGFGGANCTSETDECSMTPGICGQGTCRDRLDGDGYTCTCPDGLIDLDNTGTTCVSVKEISGGYNHTCVLTASNTLHCWGSNRYGQFGLGAVGTGAYYPNETSQTIRTPLRIKTVSGITGNASGWTHFGVGESHTCGTIPNGSGTENLYCWGNNQQGQLGRAIASATDNEPAPYLVDSTRTWSALSVGYAHNCGISGGQLYCWGYNPYGQVGNGTTTTPSPFSNTPVTLPAGETSWIAVACGGVQTCAITNTNTTYCWGRQNLGQNGVGVTSTTPRTGPTILVGGINGKVSKADPQGFTAVAADNNHACALVGTTGYCWGLGTVGSIGDGGMVNRPAPTGISGGLTFSNLVLGNGFSCGLTAVNGSNPQAYTLSCWGTNSKNILLDSSKTQVNAPQAVLSTRQWRTADAAPLHICAVDNSDGKLYCWGDNGLEGSVGQGKLGSIPYSALGNYDIGVVKAAAAIHAAP
jgi:alpha-tubulin suppressor-like RCC1 family protein